MKTRKLITKGDLIDFLYVMILLVCTGIGYIIAFVIFDYARLVAWTITGAIAGILFFLIMRYVLKEKNPMRLFR